MTPPPPAHLLAEHVGFLRALARSLVRDEHVAEDMVQEACLTVLRRPPPPHVGLRAWLAGIVRNLSFRSLRSRSRRTRHEHAAPPTPPTGPTEDVVARLEVQARLAAEVKALEEPGRTALVLRYYDGLTPSQIAERLDIPVRTVETRLRRARERLRQRLDRETRGGRAAWTLALAPLALTPQELGAVLASLSTPTTSATAATASTLVPAPAATLAGVTIMTAKTAALLAPVLAVAGFTLGRVTAPETSDKPLAPAERPPAAGEETPGQVTLGAAAEEVLDLRRRLVAERTRREEAEARVAALERQAADAAGAEGSASGTAGAAARAGRVFTVQGLEKPLEAVDWKASAEALVHMNPLMVELATAILDGKDIPPSAGEIQRWNGPLVTQALTLSQMGMPGTGVNGSFTHPSVIVNLVRATLLQAGLPLDPAQDQRLEDLGTRHSEEDARRLAGYGPDVFDLQKVVDEAALKDRLYAEIDRLLTPQQVEALHPAALRGRMSADLFSSGLVWLQFTRPLEFKDRDGLRASFLRQLRSREELEGMPTELLEDAATYWVQGFSASSLETPRDALWELRMMPVSHVRAAAEQMLKTLHYVERRAGSDPKVRELLRDALAVWVPAYAP